MRVALFSMVIVALAACSGSPAPGGSGSSGSGSTGGTNDRVSGTGGGSSGSSGTSGVPAGAKRIFVTAATYVGSSLTSAAGADQRCSLAAEAQNLGGTWKALISDSNQSALDRITGDGPWYRLDGTKAFNNKANLATVPLAPIEIDEQGQDILGTGETFVWTGTETGGSLGSVCSDWTDAFGDGTFGDATSTSNWLDVSDVQCGNGNHLYCIEQ